MKMFKRIPTLMAVLMPVFLFSIGFSSWTIFGPLNPITTDGSFEAYEVDEYIHGSAPVMFSYSSLNFCVSPTDSTPSDRGIISVGYTVAVDECDTDFGSGNWQIRLSLSYDKLAKETSDGLLKSITQTLDGITYSRTVSAKVYAAKSTDTVIEETTQLDVSVSDDGKTMTVVFVPTATFVSGGIYNFRVDYIFDIPAAPKKSDGSVYQYPTNFRTCFGQYLLNKNEDAGVESSTQFTATAEILEVVDGD